MAFDTVHDFALKFKLIVNWDGEKSPQKKLNSMTLKRNPTNRISRCSIQVPK